MTAQAKPVIDPMLLEYGTPTDRQREAVEAVNAEGGIQAASRKLGVHHSTVQELVERVKQKAAMRGYSPEEDAKGVAPSTHIAKGKSILFGDDGKIKQTWLKTDLNREAYNEMVRQAIGEFIKDVPEFNLPAGPVDYSTDVIPWLNIGDAHFGLLCHAMEVGANFDLKIAEREMRAAIEKLIDEMPECERAVINDLGDGTHYENMTATTEASGHMLDFDSRFPRMIKVYSRTWRWMVEKVATKAKFVDVIVNQGNHSRTNDFWMAEVLRVAFAHTGRVHILDNESVFIPYRMGNTFVMVHHSDKCKPTRLAHVMATDFAKDWGESKFRYIDIGHIHTHMVSKEHPGVTIESFNNLAAADRYAHDNGWRSKRSITVVLRSRTYGEIGRRLLPIEEIHARIAAAAPTSAIRRDVYSV